MLIQNNKMIKVFLEKDHVEQCVVPVSAYDFFAKLNKKSVKDLVAVKVDGVLKDLSYSIVKDVHLEPVTAIQPEGLEVIRHSTAHLLAHAVKQLYPKAQVTIGPVIENGFYYDFCWPQGFTPEDMLKIEKRMQQLVKKNIPIHRVEMSRDKAVEYFIGVGEQYKAEIIQDIPESEGLTFYQQADFTDLCRGPHVPNTRHLKAFKLMKLAGAYWRGNSDNEMLQRIYGTAWADQTDLDQYLERLAESERRDHRRLGKQMDLFHLQPVAPGMVFWHPLGWFAYQQLMKFIRKAIAGFNYEEISTPLMLSRELWEDSGHWEKFREEMFITETEKHVYAVKPMSCPGHLQVYKSRVRSYRDLPLRLAEFGCCHRNEPSGTLHGLMRVRQMVQDDGHIFCTPEQIKQEASHFIDQLYKVYKSFGFDEIILGLSTRPEKRVGEDEIWDAAELALTEVLNEKQLEWQLFPGEGAFYGPKIEFSFKDCIGRVWQCGTIQLDFSMPQRLGATYISEQGVKETPVMLHRAMIGTFERFMGILLEETAGNLPLWMVRDQVVIMNITDDQIVYCEQVKAWLEKRGVRVSLDVRNEKIGYKIRESTLIRIPYQIVCGKIEAVDGTVSVRSCQGKNLGSMKLEDFYLLIEKNLDIPDIG